MSETSGHAGTADERYIRLRQRMRAVDLFAMLALPPYLDDISRDQSYWNAKLLELRNGGEIDGR